MKDNQLTLIYTTCDSLESAKKLAKHVVKKSLAKCVNIIPCIHSVYMWEGDLKEAEEYGLIFKTSLSKGNLLIKWLAENHPYDSPALLKSDVQTTQEFQSYIES
tara:strand:- start:75 stop:386 length:312 start_codon:yes stop_codon:yes gene_type:complete